MATATARENAGAQRWELVREGGVYRGVKHYAVSGASNLAAALAADGLPATGDAFDATLPQCRANRFTPTAEPGAHSFYFVRVDYREDSATGGSGVTPEDGLVVTTTLEQSRTTEQVNLDVNQLGQLTHDGSGVPKIVNAVTLRVTSFSVAVPDLGPLLELSDSPKVNSLPISLPRFLGSEDTLDLDAGQVLYAGFRPYRQGEFFVVEHELLLRRDWKHRKYPVDASGEPSGGVIELFDVYEQADFVAVLGG